MTEEEEAAFEREHDVAVNTGGSVVVSAWGMALAVLFIAIAFASFLLSYFYLRLENPVWPPQGFPLPDLRPALLSTALMVPSGIAAWSSQRLLRSGNWGGYLGALGTALALACGAVWVFAQDLGATPFGATDHAYAAIYHTLGGFVVLVAAIAILMVATVVFWSLRGLYSHRRHAAITNVARFWNAMLVVWVIGVAVLTLGPRWT